MEAVAFEPHRPRRRLGDAGETPGDRLAAGHRNRVDRHMRDVEHVGAAEPVPGVHHAILAERDIDAGGAKLGNARQAAPARIAVMTTLQRDVDERIGDDIDPRFGDQRNELRDIVIVHRMHRGRVARRRAPAEPEPMRLAAKVSIWRDCGSSLSSQCRSIGRPRSAASRTARARSPPRLPSCARNAGCRRPHRRQDRAPASCSRRRSREAQIAVLRERDELQVEVRLNLLLHLQQRLDRQQPVVADIDVAADRQQARATPRDRNSATPVPPPLRA